MSSSRAFIARSRTAMAVALLAGIAACGGGGGGGETPPRSNLITISAANQDTVAHAAAAALGTIGVTNVLPFGAPAGRMNALAASRPAAGSRPWVTGLAAHVVGIVSSRLASADAAASPTRQPLAVYPPETGPCTLSGSMVLTWNDRNDNGNFDVGDTLAMDFNACADDATGTVNGHAEATLNALSNTSMSLGMAMSNLSTTSTNHSLGVNGSAAVDVTSDASGQNRTMRITAAGPLAIAARTHGFSDTVTLQSGFVQNARFYSDGSTRIAVTGRIESPAMAGAADMTTLSDLVTTAAGAYPNAGAIRLAGKTGKLTLTASSAAVQIDLDDDDDNEIEESKSQSWDWLL